jgi:peptidoglycan hydrolase-like protein with peptidoglycan-binding domain
VSLVFKRADAPLANAACEIRGIPGTDPEAPVMPDAEGTLTLQVPVTVREVLVYLRGVDREYHVFVGDMDPHTEPSGVRKRLENLGFYPANMPDQAPADELTRLALMVFQHAQGIEPSGEVDDATGEALLGQHLL